MSDSNEYNELVDKISNHIYTKHELDELEPYLQEENVNIYIYIYINLIIKLFLI